MKLLSILLPFALAQYDDAEKKKVRPSKVESFDCDGVAIGDAIAGATNVEVAGCLDFPTSEVVGSLPLGQFPTKAKGALGMCKFKCAEGFRPGVSERMLMDMNEKRAKKGKKPKKGGKKKRKPGKVKPPKKAKKGGIQILARCADDEGWSFVNKRTVVNVADLVCEVVVD